MMLFLIFLTRELLKNILTSSLSYSARKKNINVVHSSASFIPREFFFFDLKGNDNRKLRDKEAAAKLHEIIF